MICCCSLAGTPQCNHCYEKEVITLTINDFNPEDYTIKLPLINNDWMRQVKYNLICNCGGNYIKLDEFNNYECNKCGKII